MPSLLRPPYELNIDPNALAKRPELAAQIGIIAALWSRVEMWLGVILGDFLGTEPKFGLAMYFAIVSTSARTDTIAAAATERLDARKMLEFEKLVKTIRARARERNRIVHSNWGISAKHPDAIVSVATDDHIRFWHITSRDFQDSDRSTANWENIVWRNLKPTAYRMSDFMDICNRLNELISELQEFRKTIPR
jgi:hypothetical protein